MKLTEKIRFLWRAFRYRYNLDPGEINAFLSRLKPGDNVVDIGAHKGAYAYWMQKAVGINGQVSCFEPQPLLVNYLQHMQIGFDWRQLRIEAQGLSSAPGELILYVPAGKSTSPGASLEKDKDADDATQVSVTVTTLDDYFAKGRARPISFIKCDVEGHELEVFRGAKTILEEDQPILLFECEDRHRSGGIEEVFSFLLSLGYKGFFIDGNKERPLAEFKQDQHQVFGRKPYLNNFLFLPATRK